MKYVKGYRSVSLIQIFMCVCFFINPGFEAYGKWFGNINFFGAGILFGGALLAYFEPRRWMLWLLAGTMLCLITFNSIWFVFYGVFLASGFPLIAYDTLFVVANLHFLGKGL